MPGIPSRHSRRGRIVGALLGSVATLWSSAAVPQEGRDGATMNLYGTPGLVDMPTAEVLPDATLSATYGGFGNYTRSTLSFQITPRLSGSFRYSELKAFPFAVSEDYFDRSFDIRYLLMKESGWRPAIVVGMSDIIGTGVYSGEYVVATKTLMPGLKVTGGIGWGRFGSEATLGSLGTRPTTVLGQGGKFTTDRWFRGDMAAFGGVSYAPNDRFKFKVEYSSDQYEREVASGGVEHKSSWNFGVDYKLWQGAGQLSLYSVLGSEVGAQLTVYTNPKTLGVPGGVEPSGLPVAPRPAGAASDLGWTVDPQKTTAAQTQLAQTLASEGIRLEGMTLESRRAVVRVSNPRFNSEAQALGRIARVMTRTLPASVEQFEIIPMVNGMATSSVVIMRSDLEREEHEAAIEILPRVRFYDGFGREPEAYQSSYPQFDWSLAPYLDVSVFDPEEPVRTEGGLRGTFSLDVTPNLVFSGSASYRATGNISDISRRDESGLPRVRTDAPVYAAEGDETIENLQLAYYGRPGKNLYGRISAGYLEEMYGGVSAEILWKPVTSRVAFGAEVNWIQRRDYDQLFGFQSMTTTDPVSGVKREIPEFNGHVSAYYDFGNGFHGQLDVGRYLAGDIGATVGLDREFANGWSVGAYATVTDASAADFGEGSFDKGIRVTIPISSLLNVPTRRENNINIRSLTRDGGARLNVRGRLYEQVRDYHKPEVVESWGRFWR